MAAITISHVLNGWVVQVKCQTLVFTDPQVLTEKLRTWLTNPEATARDVLEKAVNRNRVLSSRAPDANERYPREAADLPYDPPHPGSPYQGLAPVNAVGPSLESMPQQLGQPARVR